MRHAAVFTFQYIMDFGLEILDHFDSLLFCVLNNSFSEKMFDDHHTETHPRLDYYRREIHLLPEIWQENIFSNGKYVQS